MEFKVGDKVISKYGNRDRKGTIVYIDNSSIPYKFIDDDEGMCWWLEENELELINPDLRDLLQVGHKVGYRKCNEHGSLKQISNEEYLDLIKSYTDQNLIDVGDDVFTINTIYRPKYNGLKPMEWVLVWEREEELFTLELPNNTKLERYFGIFLDDETKYGFYKLKYANRKSNHLKLFTQQEIDNLPNQELIKALVKKEVKGN